MVDVNAVVFFRQFLGWGLGFVFCKPQLHGADMDAVPCGKIPTTGAYRGLESVGRAARNACGRLANRAGSFSNAVSAGRKTWFAKSQSVCGWRVCQWNRAKFFREAPLAGEDIA